MAEKRPRETIFLGKCNFRGNDKVFGIKTRDRRQHMYVVGKTGTGKSALLKNMALQDIRAGRGLGIIDPHGEFVEEVLSQIPPERTNDVVYFNPVDSEYPIGFNVLEVPDLKYKHLVVSDLLGIFTKIWANVWSARMEYILQNCIMALLDTPGTTLLGIPRLLVDKDYRQKVIANVKDPVVKSFWVHEYEQWRDQFRNEAIVPIQNKVNQFLNTSFIRNIVGQPHSSLNVPEIMNTEKILLVNVSKGKLGEDNSQLLGAMVITKLQLAAMERVRIPEEERRDFYLYVDEFQNFATDSFASILSEARKYRLNIIIAHQYVGQLVTDISTKVRDAVFGNTGTMVVFRIGAADAEFLEQEFSPEAMIPDLTGLPNYAIYLKLMVDGVTSRPFSAATLPPLRFESDLAVKEKIIRASRERYARSRAEVEEQISRWSGLGSEMGTGGVEEGKMFEAVCSNCAKTTTVPFRPDGRRPVYCLSCLKQIEEGKLIPLPERMPQVGRAKFGSTLGDVGIEFSVSGGDVRPAEQRGGREDRFPPRGERRDMPRGESRMMSRGVPERSERPSMSQRPPVPQRPRPVQPLAPFPREDRPPQRPRISEERLPPPRGQRVFRSELVVRAPQGARPLSLSELRSKEAETSSSSGTPRQREVNVAASKLDISGLRKALDEAMKKGEVTPTPAKKEEKKVMQPGERVKL